MHAIWDMVSNAGWAGLKWLGCFVRDYQSLLAGLMALGAAVYALRPVYKQLHAMQVQTAIASRELLFVRARTIIHRRKVVDDAIRTITSDFTARLYQGDPDGPPDINIEWAFAADQIVGQVIDQFKAQQSGLGDREDIDDKRASVIESAIALQHCLIAIHQFYTHDFDDPEHEWSEREKEEAAAKAEAASKEGEKQLDARISAVANAGKDLDDAYAAELKEIRIKVLQINKLVLNENHSPF